MAPRTPRTPNLLRRLLGGPAAPSQEPEPGPTTPGAAASDPLTEPALDDAALAEVSDPALDWLDAANADAIEHWGLGSETHWVVDQDAETLELELGEGTVTFPLRIIGSFDPSDGTFLWADANPSIGPQVRAALAPLHPLAQRPGLAALAAGGRIPATFEQVTRLVALAGRTARADTVFRAINEHSVSVFLALADPTFRRARTVVAPDAFLRNAPGPAEREQAWIHVTRYLAEQRPLDAEYAQRLATDPDHDPLPEIVQRRIAIYHRYWTRSDDYHYPISASPDGTSDYDLAAYPQRLVTRHVERGVMVVLDGAYRRTCLVVETIDGQPRITDNAIDFGHNLLWSTEARARRVSPPAPPAGG